MPLGLESNRCCCWLPLSPRSSCYLLNCSMSFVRTAGQAWFSRIWEYCIPTDSQIIIHWNTKKWFSRLLCFLVEPLLILFVTDSFSSPAERLVYLQMSCHFPKFACEIAVKSFVSSIRLGPEWMQAASCRYPLLVGVVGGCWGSLATRWWLNREVDSEKVQLLSFLRVHSADSDRTPIIAAAKTVYFCFFLP